MRIIIDKIKNEKLQCNTNRDADKKSSLSSGKRINTNILQAKKYYFLKKAE